MRKGIVLLVLVCLACMSDPANADLMAIWDFGASSSVYTEVVTTEDVIGIPTLVIVGGEKDNNGKNGTPYTDAAGTFHIAGQAAAWEDITVSGQDAEWVLTINTTGWRDMTIRWDYKAWQIETDSFDLDYRLGGSGDWIEIVNNENIIADGIYHGWSYDLSFITPIENQSIVEFRMYDLDRHGNGKFAFDNLELTGVPEPWTIVLLGIGGMILRRKC